MFHKSHVSSVIIDLCARICARFYVRLINEAQCVWDAVTGSWSGVEMMVCIYQCHIRASAGREQVMIVGLDLMISPGVCSALPPVTHSGTIT